MNAFTRAVSWAPALPRRDLQLRAKAAGSRSARRLSPRIASVALALAGGLACTALRAQTPSTGSTTLAPPAARITDETIQADQQTYDALQARIKALNDGGRRVADYHLAKAQCWLDVSFHEYTRNDRSAFPQAAFDEAGKLVDAMERKTTPLPMTTPLVNGAARLRPDLWAATESLAKGAGFRCVQQAVACAEVELVHAGNEYNQQQWRHAAPYIQIAEDLLADAKARATSCSGGAPVAPPPVAVAPAPPALQPVATTAPGFVVLFAFNQSSIADIDGSGYAQLKALALRATRDRAGIGSIRLVGYADRLNRTDQRSYNRRLSEKRVNTIRDWLVLSGVDATLIETVARGAADPKTSCSDDVRPPNKRLELCLQPDRRVEVTVLPPTR